jgi:hypothetical protein
MDGTEASSSNKVIHSYLTLRNAIGFIAAFLPLAVFLGDWLIFSAHRPGCLVPFGDQMPDSLSGYYYSHMSDVFVGAMCAAGVFLIFYRGDTWAERWLTNLAGVFAVGIALFPTSRPQISNPGCVTLIKLSHGSGSAWVHSVCLIGLMAVITIMSVRFALPYSDERKNAMAPADRRIEEDVRLKKRNKRLYFGCVVAMLAAVTLAGIQEFFFNRQVKAQAPWLFYAEIVAFIAFGVAWFVKGQAITQLRQSGRAARDTLTGVRRRPRSKKPADA